MANRTLSFPVVTVIMSNGLVAWLSAQKQLSELPSDVASAGMGRPLLVNRESALTSVGPKSDTITSILGYFAMSAVSSCWVSVGSQLVGWNGVWPMKV